MFRFSYLLAPEGLRDVLAIAVVDEHGDRTVPACGCWSGGQGRVRLMWGHGGLSVRWPSRE